MKKLLLAVVCILVLSVPVAVQAFDDGDRIVVFKPGIGPDMQQKAVTNAGGVWKKGLNLVNGAAVRLPARAEKGLKNNPFVEGVYPDVTVYAKRPSGVPAGTDQVIPWGVDRIEADKAWKISTGAGVKLAVIDSGIDLDHPDLAGNICGGFNAVNRRDSYDDGFGHGTHVAGTIAALNNAYGVVGTSCSVSLYAVKVLGDDGSGKLSDLIEGLGWAVENGMQVVNISLETGQDIRPFQRAIASAYDAGVIIVAAAGNQGGPTLYPAAYPEVIAVSAVDRDGNLAPWSNYGKVEMAAPGVDILSTIPDGFIPGYLYYEASGTSMASPHVAGTVALLLATTPSAAYDKNGNGKWDPDEVKLKLKNSAENLRWLDASQQGWGLVRADRALK